MATTPAEAEQRFHKHQPYAAVVIRGMLERFPFEYLDAESLQSAGMLGLWDAAQRYDAQEGASFLTYAARRIRGAFIDELRRQSIFNRREVAEHRAYEERRNWYQQQRGYEVSDETLVELLNLPEKKAAHLRLMSTYACEDIAAVSHRLEHPGTSPDERAAVNDDLKFLGRFIAQLTDRDRFILREHYASNRPLASIGKELGITESRVCQLHGNLIQKLREYARAHNPHSVLLRYESSAASSARRIQARAHHGASELRENHQHLAEGGLGLSRRDDGNEHSFPASNGADRAAAVADCRDADGDGGAAGGAVASGVTAPVLLREEDGVPKP